MSALKRFRRFLGNDDGPTTVEYAVLLSLICGALIASVGTLTSALKDNLNSTANVINPVLGG